MNGFGSAKNTIYSLKLSNASHSQEGFDDGSLIFIQMS